MPTSLVMRAILAATALCIAPAIASAQGPQTKACKDGTTSTRSTFACFGHGGVDTAPAAARDHASAAEHHPAEPVQAGEPRARHAKATPHKSSRKAAAHHVKAEHHEARSAKKKQDEAHRGWLPWRHKKEKEQAEKKKKSTHKAASRLPIAERPNGQRQR
ncbi:MAG TPA: hypothetical protein VJW73_20290 [Gemmatimonadaceae bacterium]|nr:hypothetical protein [Gemmatimonadaceae bacterium]